MTQSMNSEDNILESHSKNRRLNLEERCSGAVSKSE